MMNRSFSRELNAELWALTIARSESGEVSCQVDEIGEAIDAVIADFIEGVGRQPSRNEIHAGIDFCLRAMDEYWDVETNQWRHGDQ